MTDSVVVEGQVRLRDGKKWKSRWVVFRKPSPVADCLLMLVFKDKSERVKGHKERCSVTLEDICGLDPGLSYEGMSQALVVVCLSQAVILGFDNKDIMHAWDVRLRYSLGEVHRFHVGVLPGTKLECGPATLHICNDILVLARDLPPVVIGQWKLTDLRRYGSVPNGFVFEGGTRCGYWAGVFFLSCAEGEQISFLFDCIVRGISPTKGPFGLRPVLPDPNVNPAYMEERVAHEALEIEKRLSILSHSSRQSSGGDDRSLSSSSSDTSHSDASIGSRLTIWPEPSSASSSMESHGMAAAKSIHLGEEKAYAEAMRPSRQPPKQPQRPRQLQEIGRQSSSDSGIATGSHSSYSGSFSSYAGSLDICHGEEFGSLLSLPLNLAADLNVCTCQHAEPPRASGSEYQVPSCSRHHYDTPRSLLHSAAARDTHPRSSDSPLTKDHAQGTASAKRLATHTETKAPPEQTPGTGRQPPSHHESTKDSRDETYVDFVPKWAAVKPQGQVSEPKSSELAPPSGVAADPCEICSPQPGITRALFAACPVCGGLKGTAVAQPGITPATQGGGSSKYAQIDIAATETAHKVGTQHAQFREERLQELEQKKKGAQQ
ncbi:protein Dok-7 isoform X2 [Ambystoma mexicanum]|uniref:protein Dok-7 isoform X2 n=1 Tax=Ambystoma mexicanum TaxID=8296 RepID=UPI0037E99D8D